MYRTFRISFSAMFFEPKSPIDFHKMYYIITPIYEGIWGENVYHLLYSSVEGNFYEVGLHLKIVSVVKVIIRILIVSIVAKNQCASCFG